MKALAFACLALFGVSVSRPADEAYTPYQSGQAGYRGHGDGDHGHHGYGGHGGNGYGGHGGNGYGGHGGNGYGGHGGNGYGGGGPGFPRGPGHDPRFSPLLFLPYATYSPALYDAEKDIYTYTNIQFGAPPIGPLRWRKPAPPVFMGPQIQDGSHGNSCFQSRPTNYSQSEDCLYLDVYVPGKAARAPFFFNLPVVVFIHGGGNNNGAKDQQPTLFYNGTGPVSTSQNDIIVISINYRLGAFGYLAGDTSEREGLPNAGLHDQRAAFRWVQTYIRLLGGDPGQVTAWGESGGASDIFHHLIAQGGTLDPLFQKAFIQSPAAFDNVDRLGISENCYQIFKSLAGCDDGGYECLRSLDSDTLQTANMDWIAQNRGCGNLAADGTFIRQAANLEYKTGNFWQGLESIIVSHVNNEADLFLPQTPVTDDPEFVDFITPFYPSYSNSSGIFDAVLNFYPSPNSTQNSPYANQTERLSQWIMDFFFTVRVRTAIEAYFDRAWALQYSIPSSPLNRTLHSADLIPLFWNDYMTSLNLTNVPPFNFTIPPNMPDLATTYQSYAISHAKTGDPNTFAITDLPDYPGVTWPRPGPLTADGLQTGVLNFAPDGAEVITDQRIVESEADFVVNIDAALTNVGGYAVPGTAVNTKIATCDESASLEPCASRNYVNQCTECIEF